MSTTTPLEGEGVPLAVRVPVGEDVLVPLAESPTVSRPASATVTITPEYCTERSEVKRSVRVLPVDMSEPGSVVPLPLNRLPAAVFDPSYTEYVSQQASVAKAVKVTRSLALEEAAARVSVQDI